MKSQDQAALPGQTAGPAARSGTGGLAARLAALVEALGEGPEAQAGRHLVRELLAREAELDRRERERERHAPRPGPPDVRQPPSGRDTRRFELAPAACVALSPQGLVLEANRAARALFGCSEPLTEGEPFARRLAPADVGPFLEHVAAVCAAPSDPARAPAPAALTVRPKGTAGPVAWRLTSVAGDGEDGPECLLALRPLPEEAADAGDPGSDADGRLGQAVLDTLPSQVVVLSPAGRILAVNRAWRDFAEENGGSSELAAGIGLDYLATCRNVQGEDAALAHPVAEGIEAVIERRAPGFACEYPCDAPWVKRWFALTATPLNHAAEGAVVVHYDVTARKNAEIEARRAREAAAQAARVNAVGILAASLIHELTQPLSAAGFFSGAAVAMLAQGEQDPQRLRQALEGTDSQLQRAAEIVERLREFIRHREMRMAPLPVDVPIARALGLAEWFALDKRVRLVYKPPPAPCVVRADCQQVEQVLVNLICNSIQAIDEAGSPQREVAVSVEPAPGEVVITVRDTGPGLPAEVRKRLFDAFASTKDLGLGMGLAISRDILEAHGGRLWAEAEPTEGAVFHFSLPREDSGVRP